MTITAPAPTLAAPVARRPHFPWARVAPLLLALTAGLVYAWGVRNGQLHNYYSPAVKSMTESWKAFLWGGYDPAASITLDKLPGAFQVEALSARIFGYSSWSLLLPQVVESVLAVLVLYGMVRRWMGPVAGIVAAAAFATTPIVAALAHAEISDTLLTLLLILAADAWLRAVRAGRLGWLLLSGVWVGLAFQTKMVQAWGVLPALAVGYLLAAPGPLRRRLGHVGLAGVVTVAVSLYWVVLASVVPASMRPYIDGSTNNSAWSMVFDYNLFSRYETGASGVGWTYLLGSSVATQVGWLYPVALIGLALGLSGRRPRTDVVRAGFVMWGLWLAVHAVAFSEGRVAHSFYVVSVAPAVSALAGGGLVLMWRAYRRGGARRWVLPAAVVATVAWALYLSSRFPTFMPWLTPLVAVLGAVAAGLLVLVTFVVGRPKLRARLALVAVVATLGALLAAPATWAASTVDAAYSGSSIGPAAGPVAAFGPGGGGGGGGRFPGGAPGSIAHARP